MKLLRISALVGMVLALQLSLQATTVLVYVLPGELYVASDSMIVKIGDHGDETRTSCKIHIAPGFVWASAGLMFTQDKQFDIAKFVPNAMGKGKQFFESVDALEKSLRQEAPRLATYFKQLALPPGAAGIELAVVSSVTVGQFSKIAVGINSLHRTDYRSGDSGLIMLGQREQIRKIAADQTIFLRMGTIPALNYLILQEELANPKKVGGAVAIVKIDSTGAHWIQKAGCK
jgi:hypothetical protein